MMPARGTSKAGTANYIQERVRLTASGCIEWTSTLSEDGYGKAVVGYRGHGRPIRRYAHVVVFEMWRGSVPSGLELDHLCRNRACVNPDHLEPVTRKENVRRGMLPQLMRDTSWRPNRPRLAVCKHGHALSGDNIGQNSKRRWCRACKAAEARKRRHK